ncbi:MAG: hypothetical protein ACPG21_14270 [Crocinitomicaceae bacterium]
MNPNALKHLKRAKAAMEEQKKIEAEKSAAYYKRMTTGTPWLIFGIGAIFCVIISVLTTYDTLATSEIVHLSPEDYDFDRDAYSKAGTIIWVDDEIYTADYMSFISVDYESFRIAKSALFNHSKYLVFLGHSESDPKDFYCYQRISIYEWFPWLQIGLLIPLFVFLFKRQQPWFTFLRMTSLLVIIPAATVILLFLVAT